MLSKTLWFPWFIQKSFSAARVETFHGVFLPRITTNDLRHSSCLISVVRFAIFMPPPNKLGRGVLASLQTSNRRGFLSYFTHTSLSLKGLAQAKIIKKSVILFRVLNMTI